MPHYLPDGYSHVCAALCVDGAADAIDWYCQVLGGSERMRMDGPGGTVMHAEVLFGESVLMLSDPFPEMNWHPPAGDMRFSAAINLYVEDVDEVTELARQRGASVVAEPADQFYGDRSATFVDPFGHQWSLMQHIEDVTPEEMERRMAEMAGGEG